MDLVDGFAGATSLSLAAAGGVDNILGHGLTWMDAFLGHMQGSMGETSTLAIFIGGAVLLLTRIASWRIVAGVMLGMVAMSYLFNAIARPATRCSPCPGIGTWSPAASPSA